MVLYSFNLNRKKTKIVLMLKKLSLIFSCTFDGALCCHISSKYIHNCLLKKFYHITCDNEDDPYTINAVIMGRRTWESLEVPIKNRINIIVTSNRHATSGYDNVIFVHSIIAAITYCNYNQYIKNIYVIGGASILNDILQTKMYHKIIDKVFVSVIFECCEATDHIDLNALYLNFDWKKDERYLRYSQKRIFASYICNPK